LALIGFLFLDWFGLDTFVQGSVKEGDGSELGFVNVAAGGGFSGWDSLGWFALALCVIAIVAGLAVPIAYARSEGPALAQFTAVLSCMFGILAIIALIVQVIFQPGPDEIVGVESGWWLGLLACLGIARGGYLSMHDEYIPDVPLPDVEVRPVPSIEAQ
jgi:hypothetical protein